MQLLNTFGMQRTLSTTMGAVSPRKITKVGGFFLLLLNMEFTVPNRAHPTYSDCEVKLFCPTFNIKEITALINCLLCCW